MILPVQISAAKLKMSELKKRLTSNQSKEMLGWAHFDKQRVPYLIRSEEKYVCLSMLEYIILKTFCRRFNNNEIKNCTDFVIEPNICCMTDDEMALLSKVNYKFRSKEFRLTYYKRHIELITLELARQLYDFTKFCNKIPLRNNVKIRGQCGFIKVTTIDDPSQLFLPYVWYNLKQYVPLFYLEGELKYLEERSIELKDFELAYLKFLCKVHGINKRWYDKQSLIVVEVQYVKKVFLSKTSFEERWPYTLHWESLIYKRSKKKSKIKESESKTSPLQTVTENQPVKNMNKHKPCPLSKRKLESKGESSCKKQKQESTSYVSDNEILRNLLKHAGSESIDKVPDKICTDFTPLHQIPEKEEINKIWSKYKNLHLKSIKSYSKQDGQNEEHGEKTKQICNFNEQLSNQSNKDTIATEESLQNRQSSNKDNENVIPEKITAQNSVNENDKAENDSVQKVWSKYIELHLKSIKKTEPASVSNIEGGKLDLNPKETYSIKECSSDQSNEPNSCSVYGKLSDSTIASFKATQQNRQSSNNELDKDTPEKSKSSMKAYKPTRKILNSESNNKKCKMEQVSYENIKNNIVIDLTTSSDEAEDPVIVNNNSTKELLETKQTNTHDYKENNICSQKNPVNMVVVSSKSSKTTTGNKTKITDLNENTALNEPNQSLNKLSDQNKTVTSKIEDSLEISLQNKLITTETCSTSKKFSESLTRSAAVSSADNQESKINDEKHIELNIPTILTKTIPITAIKDSTVKITSRKPNVKQNLLEDKQISSSQRSDKEFIDYSELQKLLLTSISKVTSIAKNHIGSETENCIQVKETDSQISTNEENTENNKPLTNSSKNISTIPNVISQTEFINRITKGTGHRKEHLQSEQTTCQNADNKQIDDGELPPHSPKNIITDTATNTEQIQAKADTNFNKEILQNDQVINKSPDIENSEGTKVLTANDVIIIDSDSPIKKTSDKQEEENKLKEETPQNKEDSVTSVNYINDEFKEKQISNQYSEKEFIECGKLQSISKTATTAENCIKSPVEKSMQVKEISNEISTVKTKIFNCRNTEFKQGITEGNTSSDEHLRIEQTTYQNSSNKEREQDSEEQKGKLPPHSPKNIIKDIATNTKQIQAKTDTNFNKKELQNDQIINKSPDIENSEGTKVLTANDVIIINSDSPIKKTSDKQEEENKLKEETPQNKEDNVTSVNYINDEFKERQISNLHSEKELMEYSKLESISKTPTTAENCIKSPIEKSMQVEEVSSEISTVKNKNFNYRNAEFKQGITEGNTSSKEHLCIGQTTYQNSDNKECEPDSEEREGELIPHSPKYIKDIATDTKQIQAKTDTNFNKKELQNEQVISKSPDNENSEVTKILTANDAIIIDSDSSIKATSDKQTEENKLEKETPQNKENSVTSVNYINDEFKERQISNLHSEKELMEYSKLESISKTATAENCIKSPVEKSIEISNEISTVKNEIFNCRNAEFVQEITEDNTSSDEHLQIEQTTYQSSGNKDSEEQDGKLPPHLSKNNSNDAASKTEHAQAKTDTNFIKEKLQSNQIIGESPDNKDTENSELLKMSTTKDLLQNDSDFKDKEICDHIDKACPDIQRKLTTGMSQVPTSAEGEEKGEVDKNDSNDSSLNTSRTNSDIQEKNLESEQIIDQDPEKKHIGNGELLGLPTTEDTELTDSNNFVSVVNTNQFKPKIKLNLLKK